MHELEQLNDDLEEHNLVLEERNSGLSELAESQQNELETSVSEIHLLQEEKVAAAMQTAALASSLLESSNMLEGESGSSKSIHGGSETGGMRMAEYAEEANLSSSAGKSRRNSRGPSVSKSMRRMFGSTG